MVGGGGAEGGGGEGAKAREFIEHPFSAFCSCNL